MELTRGWKRHCHPIYQRVTSGPGLGARSASRLPTSCAFHLDVKREPVGPAPGAARAEPGGPPLISPGWA